MERYFALKISSLIFRRPKKDFFQGLNVKDLSDKKKFSKAIKDALKAFGDFKNKQ